MNLEELKQDMQLLKQLKDDINTLENYQLFVDFDKDGKRKKAIENILDFAQLAIKVSEGFPKEKDIEQKYHYICHGGSIVRLEDSWGDNPIGQCHNSGKKGDRGYYNAEGCQDCDRKIKGYLDIPEYIKKDVIYNQARSECLAWVAGKLAGIEKIILYSVGLEANQRHELTQAIIKHFEVKERKE